MNQRSFLQTLPAAAATLALASCGRETERNARREAGFTDAEINTLFVDNPASAFSIDVRSTRT